MGYPIYVLFISTCHYGATAKKWRSFIFFWGNAQVVGGVKKTGDFLNNSTWTLGTGLIALSLIANLILSGNHQGQGTSALDGYKAPKTTTQPVQVPSTEQQNNSQK